MEKIGSATKSDISLIETLFRKQVLKDPRVINASLLVHSGKTGLHLNLAEGDIGGPLPLSGVAVNNYGGKGFEADIYELRRSGRKGTGSDDRSAIIHHERICVFIQVMDAVFSPG
jgi:hypothetical protein